MGARFAYVNGTDSIETSQESFWCQLNSSISASFVAVVIANPLWVVRTRIMTQPAQPCPTAKYYYTSVFHGIQSIIQQEGWTSLYKGLGPSFLGISHVAVQFPLYEQLKIFLRGLGFYLISHPQNLNKIKKNSHTPPSFSLPHFPK